MGCTESAPVYDDFNVAHKIDPRIPALADHAGPSNNPVQVIVKEKLFSWSGDSFKIKTPSGMPFGNGIQMQGKVFAFRDQMVLLDGQNQPIAVCLRKFELVGQTFKIYTTRPLYAGQARSNRDYKGRALYTFASVERVPLSTTQRVTYANQSTPSYTIQRAGGLWPKKRIVRNIANHGEMAAFMEGGTWQGNWNSYRLSVNPGIDPCLMVCLTAICDEMDEQ